MLVPVSSIKTIIHKSRYLYLRQRYDLILELLPIMRQIWCNLWGYARIM